MSIGVAGVVGVGLFVRKRILRKRDEDKKGDKAVLMTEMSERDRV